MTGLIIATGLDSGCRGRVSRTIRFFSRPTWGAARPTPSAEYMVSNRSATRVRRASSKAVMGSAVFFRTGSGHTMISRTMAFSCNRWGRGAATEGSVREISGVLNAEAVVPEDQGGLGERLVDRLGAPQEL